MSNVLGAKALPDDDPVFDGIPPGECRRVNGVFLVRESEWLEFLKLIARVKGIEQEFLRGVLQ